MAYEMIEALNARLRAYLQGVFPGYQQVMNGAISNGGFCV
jgi:hypothetical protein